MSKKAAAAAESAKGAFCEWRVMNGCKHLKEKFIQNADNRATRACTDLADDLRPERAPSNEQKSRGSGGKRQRRWHGVAGSNT